MSKNNNLAIIEDIDKNMIGYAERDTFCYVPQFESEDKTDELFNAILNPKASGAVPLKDMVNRKIVLKTFYTEPREVMDKDADTDEVVVQSVVDPTTGEVREIPVMKRINYVVLFGTDESGKEVTVYSSSATFYGAFVKAVNFFGQALFNGKKQIVVTTSTKGTKQYYSLNVSAVK